MPTIERERDEKSEARRAERIASVEAAGGTGIATAAGGAAIGALLGPEGAIVGAILGAIVGIVLGRH